MLVANSNGLVTERIILSASVASVNRDPAVVEAVLRGFRDAEALIRNYPADAERIVAKDTGVTRDRVATILGFTHYELTYDKRFVDDMTQESKEAVKLELLKGPVDLRRHFLTKFLASLGPEFVTAGR